MDFPSALTAATAALDIAKGLRAVEKSYDTVELKMRIVDLIDKLIDVKSALQDAKEELDSRDREIGKLKQAAQFRAETVVVDGFRYEKLAGSENAPRGLPFCQQCDEQDGKLVRTISAPSGRGCLCPKCKTHYIHAGQYPWEYRVA